MNSRVARGIVGLTGAFVMTLTVGLSGCGGNANEREFMEAAPPGAPSPFPNESVAQRKSRTKGEPKPNPKKAGTPGKS